MDESKDREDRELAEQQWRALSAEDRESLREAARRAIAESHDLHRAPYEEVALPEVVDEIVIKMLTRMHAEWRARIEEHTTDEDFARWIVEESNHLSPDYPDGAPEDVLVDAIMDRARRERPEALKARRRRT
jgi:hypothetical protein